EKMYYEPADAELPTENLWSTELYIDHVPKLFDRLRQTVGFGPHLLHDCHHRLKPIEAARVGKSLEPYRLFWIADTVPAENQASF
ncbi:bifunctional D-altronate/D-mannonate dehydratase, partial [Acinetobacter baumannii]